MMFLNLYNLTFNLSSYSFSFRWVSSSWNLCFHSVSGWSGQKGQPSACEPLAPLQIPQVNPIGFSRTEGTLTPFSAWRWSSTSWMESRRSVLRTHRCCRRGRSTTGSRGSGALPTKQHQCWDGSVGCRNEVESTAGHLRVKRWSVQPLCWHDGWKTLKWLKRLKRLIIHSVLHVEKKQTMVEM